MALQKSTKYKGFIADYWTITSLSDNKSDGLTRVTVSLYKDQGTRQANPEATLDCLNYTIQGTDMVRSEIYPMLKTTTPDGQEQTAPYYFENATDC